jgi:alkaline phosphatase
MVVAFPDHNTGALALGNEYSPVPYTATSVEDLIGPLQGMKVTSGFLEGQIDDKKSPAEIKAAVQEYWGISLTDDNVTEILQRTGAIAPDPVYQDLGTQSLGYAIAEVVSRRHTVFGWTTHGHSGEDVPLWSYGPMGPVGFLDNTQLAETTAQALGLNLDLSDRKGLNAELFVEAGEAFPYRFKMDLSDQENPVLRIGRWRLPAGKDLLIRASGVGPRSCELDGLAIYAPETGKGYIPRQAVKIIRRPWLWWRYCR